MPLYQACIHKVSSDPTPQTLKNTRPTSLKAAGPCDPRDPLASSSNLLTTSPSLRFVSPWQTVLPVGSVSEAPAGSASDEREARSAFQSAVATLPAHKDNKPGGG